MLEREGKKPETYSKDNKAYMNMLNRLYTASKEGKFETANKYIILWSGRPHLYHRLVNGE